MHLALISFYCACSKNKQWFTSNVLFVTLEKSPKQLVRPIYQNYNLSCGCLFFTYLELVLSWLCNSIVKSFIQYDKQVLNTKGF